MSKQEVKKLISEFTPEQLRGLILDIYSKSKDAKEFLDFFAVPETDKLYEKFLSDITDEIYRIKHYVPAPRVAQIRSMLKKFAQFEPGYELVGQLMAESTSALINHLDPRKNFTDGVFNGSVKLLDDTLKFLSKNGIDEEYLPSLTEDVKAKKTDKWYLNGYYTELKEVIEKYIDGELE